MRTKNNENNAEFNKCYNSINEMSYEQLDKIHDKLLPLCNEITFVMIPHVDNNGKPIWNSPEVSAEKLKQKKTEILPEIQQIYGCKTYGDAEKLNQAIVKRLDELGC